MDDVGVYTDCDNHFTFALKGSLEVNTIKMQWNAMFLGFVDDLSSCEFGIWDCEYGSEAKMTLARKLLPPSKLFAGFC